MTEKAKGRVAMSIYWGFWVLVLLSPLACVGNKPEPSTGSHSARFSASAIMNGGNPVGYVVDDFDTGKKYLFNREGGILEVSK